MNKLRENNRGLYNFLMKIKIIMHMISHWILMALASIFHHTG